MKKSKIFDILKKYYKILILIVFVGLAILIGSHHEPWADETQAWLIAEDTTFFELFFRCLHAEGHPALWYLILKFFQFLKLPIKYMFVISIIFSTIGVYCFLYKSKYPWYIKCMLPFTYFIFYQYTIVVRSYCLIFPLLMILASLWEEKNEKNNFYTFILILLISCELYTYVLAFMIWLYDIYNFFNNKNNYSKNEKNKLIRNFIVSFIAFFVTALYVYPSSTIEPVFIKSSSYYLSDSFFTTFFGVENYLKIIITLIIIGFIYLIYKNEKKKLIKFIVFFVPIIFSYYLIYVKPWHFGIILIVFLFLFWIDGYENKKSVKLFLIIVCIIQMFWNVKNSYYDYNEIYSSAKIVADYIKKYDYKNLKIAGTDFFDNAVLYYFDENIFINWSDDRFFDFNHNYFEYADIDYVMDNEIDIIVSDKLSPYLKREELEEKYNYYEFEGKIYFEGKQYPSQEYVVYVKKNIDILKESND